MIETKVVDINELAASKHAATMALTDFIQREALVRPIILANALEASIYLKLCSPSSNTAKDETWTFLNKTAAQVAHLKSTLSNDDLTAIGSALERVTRYLVDGGISCEMSVRTDSSIAIKFGHENNHYSLTTIATDNSKEKHGMTELRISSTYYRYYAEIEDGQIFRGHDEEVSPERRCTGTSETVKVLTSEICLRLSLADSKNRTALVLPRPFELEHFFPHT